MPTITLGSNYATLSAMLTPALFMTANGSLIISTSNRMTRIVDRVRSTIDLADRLDRGAVDLDFPEQRRDGLAVELQHLEWRSDRVRIALTVLYMALSAFIGSSLTLALDATLGSSIPFLPTFLAVLGVALMLLASVNLTLEAHRALRSNRREVRFHRELLALRHKSRA